jgi:hypothetical protein
MMKRPTTHCPRPCLATFLAAQLALVCLSAPAALSDQRSEDLTLKDAAVCESFKGNLPVNAGAVFSIAVGRVSCLTSFAPTSRRAIVFHSWFHRDHLSSKQRVAITPSDPVALSSIQLREADKGPWQVEVSDGSGRTLKILRFSIVD